MGKIQAFLKRLRGEAESVTIRSKRGAQLRALGDRIIWPDDSGAEAKCFVIKFADPVSHRKLLEAIMGSRLISPTKITSIAMEDGKIFFENEAPVGDKE